MYGRTVHVRPASMVIQGWSGRSCAGGRCGRCVVASIGVRRSAEAHQRVDLSQSIQIPSLIRAEEQAIMKAIGTQEARLSSVSRIKNLTTFSWLSRRQHPGHRKRPPSGILASQAPVRSSRTTMYVVPVQDTRPNSPCRMGIIRPTWRADDGSSLLVFEPSETAEERLYLNVYSYIWRGRWFYSSARTRPHHHSIV